ncbi:MULTISPECIES: TetR family transcriptional regulator [unclassified Mycolicibacterium]|uniref:TetR family transcriptional regulator n=1 Tax=unclassified Mycolicibacterium TaxID=2636767 RepID=UPI001391CBE3
MICATLWRHFARRQVLAAQAASGLAELGFARASMRELARHCWISLGVLHYYFVD